jgi:hypothetical protein
MGILAAKVSLPAEDQKPRRDPLSKYLRYSHVGLQFFLSVGIFTGGGVWLDRRLGTLVLFTLIGLALGFAGGFFALYRELYPQPRDGDGKRGGDRGSGPE